MKRYITVDTFKNDYLFSAINNQQLNDEQIKYAIGVASTRINSIVGGAITKGIRGGYYTYDDINGLKLNEASITDASQLAEAKDATEALFEQIGAMTKFAIDTGWDFLSGSFSTSLGAQADAETIDFEASLASLERTVKEALNIYDFSTLFFTEELDVAFFEDDTTATAGQPYVPASDRTLTEAQLVARLTSQWLKGDNGIVIELQVPGQPDQGIVIKNGHQSIVVNYYDTENKMFNNALDGELGYSFNNGNADLYLKNAGKVDKFLSLINLEKWLMGQNTADIALLDFDLIGGTGTGNPGGLGDTQSFEVGTLDTQQEREDFLKIVKDETYYHFKFGGEDFEVRTTNVVADTSATFRGTRTTTHSNGDEIVEYVKGIITPTNISNQLSSIRVESVITPFLKPADQYDATEIAPLAVMEQLVKDGRSLNDFEEAYGIIGNQIESKYDDTTKEKTWRFGKTIKSNEVFTTGHPMEDGMYVSFYDDFNNWIPFTLHDGFEKNITFKRSILVNGSPTIKQTTATLRVSKINDWDNAWNGAGVPTGTDEGWKVLIFNIKDGQSGVAITESHVLTPTHMKLDMLAPVVNDEVVEEEAVVPDVPKDFLINTDNDLGKSSKNKEMVLQYNVADSLGNTFTSYNRNSSQVINLPANKTIYDITKISGYTNNKYKWYSVDNEGNLQKRLSYLTLDNHTMFGNGCKIIVENHRSDDHNELTFTEYLVLEVRPVIENGVMNIHKLHLTNKGIITGGGDHTLKVLVDNAQDPNTEIAQAAHIHYINIWFRGGA